MGKDGGTEDCGRGSFFPPLFSQRAGTALRRQAGRRGGRGPNSAYAARGGGPRGGEGEGREGNGKEAGGLRELEGRGEEGGEAERGIGMEKKTEGARARTAAGTRTEQGED